MKKVLGLVISQRKYGNSELLVKEIMSSIPEECSYELIRLTDHKIEPCKACYRCLQPESKCVLQDDFNFVMDKIKAADALIIGVPVYILGPHGYYKMLTDRILGSENYSKYTKDKPCVIVTPYGTRRWEGYSKGAVLAFPRFLKMRIVDCWEVFATLPGEALMTPEKKNYAQELGKGIFSGRENKIGARECSCCGSNIVKLLPERKVECATCGALGILKDDNLPDFSDTDYCRFSEKDMDEHFNGFLVEMKQKFLTEKDRIKEIQKDYKGMDWWVSPDTSL